MVKENFKSFSKAKLVEFPNTAGYFGGQELHCTACHRFLMIPPQVNTGCATATPR